MLHPFIKPPFLIFYFFFLSSSLVLFYIHFLLYSFLPIPHRKQSKYPATRDFVPIKSQGLFDITLRGPAISFIPETFHSSPSLTLSIPLFPATSQNYLPYQQLTSLFLSCHWRPFAGRKKSNNFLSLVWAIWPAFFIILKLPVRPAGNPMSFPRNSSAAIDCYDHFLL